MTKPVFRKSPTDFSNSFEDKFWVYKNKLHRTDGPAIEWADGTKEWYLFGDQYEPLAWLLKLHELGLK